MSRLTEFLGMRRNMAGLLAMVVLVGMGEHMAERFLPLYLQQLATGTTGIFAIGGLAFLDDFLSALYSFPGGYLTERFGHKRALLVFNLISMAGYLIVIFIRQWWAVLVGAALFISWSAISLPAMMELIAHSVPAKKRTMGVSLHSLVRRVPKTLGPVLGVVGHRTHHGSIELSAGRALRRPHRDETIRAGDVWVLHAVSGDAVVLPIADAAGAGVCAARAEVVRRTDA